MATAKLNKKVPAFDLPATGDKNIKLSALKGKKVIIYFYPKDSTPGCTTEGQDFRDNHNKFKRAGAIVLGVSRDSIKSHENFKTKQEFPFDLISDKEEILCGLFDVIKEKNMYGKKVFGIERSTFLLDEKSVLRQEWRKVKVAEHVEEVLTATKAL
jgi:peroxiredoxin Q/BCP